MSENLAEEAVEKHMIGEMWAEASADWRMFDVPTVADLSMLHVKLRGLT